MRLYGYVRVSTDEQAREGVSVDAQKHRLSAWCEAMDAECVGVEVDEGVSGAVAPARRPGLARILKALDAGEADGLLVLKLDRLSRSTRDTIEMVDACRKHGWRLVSVTEQLDTGSAAGRLVLTVLAALAEMEREMIAERTKMAMDEIARQGLARSRFTPFGWRVEGGAWEVTNGNGRHLVPHEGEQEILSLVEHHRGQGLGARRIASRIQAKGLPNPRTGGIVTRRMVERMLGGIKRREASDAS